MVKSIQIHTSFVACTIKKPRRLIRESVKKWMSLVTFKDDGENMLVKSTTWSFDYSDGIVEQVCKTERVK